MTIEFISTDTNIITVAQIQAIHDNLMAQSSIYYDKIEEIEASGLKVEIRIGYADQLGMTWHPNEGWTDSSNPDVSIVRIPLELVAGAEYDPGKLYTIERALAHEVGGHAYAHAIGADAYNETYALSSENIIMAQLGEPADPHYGEIQYDYGGSIYYYNGTTRTEFLHDLPMNVMRELEQWWGTPAVEKISDSKTTQSPLVLDLDGDGVELTNLSTGAVYWDADKDGFAEASAWVSADDGLLAIDLDHDGGINNHGELFGNQTGQDNGFEALKQYDSNSDGKITNEDQAWSQLKVWIDANGDGYSESGELHSLDSLNITQIDLDYSASNTTDNGNTIKQTGSFVIKRGLRIPNYANRNNSGFSVDNISLFCMN